ncbi:hypothetical protein B0T24DRAFT_609335 [Lasiosphaeria ovina]|uniref:Uncharacterized protein n=1 Tax=Lasiosphaeria ovina TaxID=92902 RepID=A0AAE0TZ25_9PEZI|nr:hypothetical protein B0T24DRAFT_609335 [Lasiosphaeria ovina]
MKTPTIRGVLAVSISASTASVVLNQQIHRRTSTTDKPCQRHQTAVLSGRPQLSHNTAACNRSRPSLVRDSTHPESHTTSASPLSLSICNTSAAWTPPTSARRSMASPTSFMERWMMSRETLPDMPNHSA